ncbi:hypothetical protein A9Q94_14265 [Rhodobacterales bacterium 56_14_T64]|nr:hypothetical protein A9Q94_14265 [Rhodobacterales bacterium 56_14_T64]
MPVPPAPKREFLTILAMLMALPVLSINIVLPAYHQITMDFGLSSASQVGLMASMIYLGLAAGQILFGPVSDSIGRKPTLIIGILIFLIGCLISGLAIDFRVLVIGQIVQGLGLGAPRILTLAILRDKLSGAAMASAMSFVMMIFVIVPTLSPYLGQIIVSTGGWRVIYVVLIGMGISLALFAFLRLEETLPVAKRADFSPGSVLSLYLSVLRNRFALGYAVALGLMSGPFLAYLNLSQQVFEFQYSLGSKYPLMFALLSLWVGVASFTNARIVQRIGLRALTSITFTVVLVASLLAIGALTFSDLPFWAFTAYISCLLFCIGLLVSNLNALAMSSLGETAGTGAALIGATSTLVSIPIAIFIGHFYAGSVLPIVLGFGLGAVASLLLHLRLQMEKNLLPPFENPLVTNVPPLK